ncbi:hypothetical protein B0O99DRAFT_683791 [Bisporella sp. PMI_857]|nr:hypothetical protein B0O99DRAFT_693275 [Bisporella sp. PMI_857]KAH8599072.1 hypothetical protein B0O99DRAFT_683791 [Bisporella sp. PMI_857]
MQFHTSIFKFFLVVGYMGFKALGAPQGINLIDGLVGNDYPPLFTSVHSAECKDINQGTYMCCGLLVNGGFAVVQALAAAAHYPLTLNTINGLSCLQEPKECKAPLHRVCCQVIALQPAASLYCSEIGNPRPLELLPGIL